MEVSEGPGEGADEPVGALLAMPFLRECYNHLGGCWISEELFLSVEIDQVYAIMNAAVRCSVVVGSWHGVGAFRRLRRNMSYNRICTTELV